MHWRRTGETGWATEVTALGNFNQNGAAVIGPGSLAGVWIQSRYRHGTTTPATGLIRWLAAWFEIMPGIAGQERRKTAVLRAGLVHPDLTPASENFSVNSFQAMRADARSAFEQEPFSPVSGPEFFE